MIARVAEAQKKAEAQKASAFQEKLAATYSRGVYKTTTIGHAVFDGRVRNGNGSDHCGNATKLLRTVLTCKILKIISEVIRRFSENYTQESIGTYNSRVEIAFPIKEKAIKPHDRLVLVS